MKKSKLFFILFTLYSFNLYSQNTLKQILQNRIDSLKQIENSIIYKNRDIDDKALSVIRGDMEYLQDKVNILTKHDSIIKSIINANRHSRKLFFNTNEAIHSYMNLLNTEDTLFLAIRLDSIFLPYQSITSNNEKKYSRKRRRLKTILKKLQKINTLSNKYKWCILKVDKKENQFVLSGDTIHNPAPSFPHEYKILYEDDPNFIKNLRVINYSYVVLQYKTDQNHIFIDRYDEEKGAKTVKAANYKRNIHKLSSIEEEKINSWWQNKIAAVIKFAANMPDNKNDTLIMNIYIEGYASPDGDFVYNKILSEKRTIAVHTYMEKLLENSRKIKLPKQTAIKFKIEYFGESKTPKHVQKNDNWQKLTKISKDKYLKSLRVAVFYAEIYHSHVLRH